MSILVCPTCHLPTNTRATCPKCGAITRLNENPSWEERLRGLHQAQLIEEERRNESEKRRHGPLSYDALAWITHDLQRAADWCGESREAAQMKKAIDAALGLLREIERKRAV